MGAIPAARLYHTKYRELPPPPPGNEMHHGPRMVFCTLLSDFLLFGTPNFKMVSTMAAKLSRSRVQITVFYPLGLGQHGVRLQMG